MTQTFAPRREAALMLAFASFAMAPAATAQEIPIVQSGAEGRYERQLDPKTSVPGFETSSFQSFRSAVGNVVAQLSAMPSVTSPPAPVCHRLMSYLEIVRAHGVFSGSVSVMSPIKFENGRCHRMTGGGIEIWLNRMSSVFERNRAQVPEAEGGRTHWFVMQPEFEGNIIRMPKGQVLITKGTPLLRPVSGRRYVAEQLKREEADLPAGSTLPRPWRDLSLSLTAEAAERPACLDETMLSIELTANCVAARQVWEVNPDYFDTKRMGDIQLIVLSTPQGPYHGESDERFKARQAVWQALDLARLSALVRG